MNKLTSSRLPRLVLALGATLITSSACADLIGHWQFDEGSGTVAADSAGSHPGTLSGGVSYIPGKIGPGALQFDGTSGYVEVGGANSALELAGTPYTIAFYVKWESGIRMINMDDGEDYSGGYAIRFSNNRLRWTHNTGVDQTWAPSTIAPSTNWQHFALVWDGTNRFIYRDGALAATQATAEHLTSDHDDPLWFGGIPNYGQYFKGALDDVRIYNAALTSSNITEFFGVPIIISRQPSSVTIRQGASTSFSVEAHVLNDKYPASELRYQWQKDQADIPGAESRIYTLNSPVPADSGGKFRVRISHPQLQQSETSSEALLVVLDPTLPALVGHWKFDEGTGTNAINSAGTQNGNIIGATYIPGRLGTALLFNGTNAHVEVGGMGTSLELRDTSYTITWWQKWGGPTGEPQRIFNMDDGNDVSAGYSLWINNGGRILATHNNGYNDAQTWNTGVTPSTRWQHYALVWNRFTRTLYVDGMPTAAVTTARDLFSEGDDPLWFGGMEEHGQFFKGALDDIRIYSGAMTDDEVLALIPPEENLKIRVGTFNVGHFNQGALGGYQQSDPEQAAERWRAWIDQQSLDVFLVNEWNFYFDKAGTMDATALLLKPSYTNVFFGKENTWIYNGIATDFNISNIRQVVLTHTEYYAVLADWQVGNAVITLMSVHVPWQDCCHETSIDALIAELKKHRYVICGGDLNAPDRNVLKIRDAGFNVANGGDEGWLCTVAARCGTTTTNVHIDNIITSTNIEISNVAAPYTGLNDLDHLPIMADLEINLTEAAMLLWQGAGAGSNWDVGVSFNWLDWGVSSVFTNGTAVRFDDTAVTFSPNIATNVQPGSVTVGGTKDYQFSGPGGIDGATGLRKEGTGVLSIANSNTFSGPVVVDNGVLRYGVAGALGASATNRIYATNNGSLDLNNMDAGSRTIAIAGSGYGGRGAIINSPTDTGVKNLVGSLEFLGDATLGSSGRWNMKTGGTVHGNGHNLTKVGSGQVWLYRCGETGLGDIEVKEGSFGAYPPLGLGDPSKTLTVQAGAALCFWRNAEDLSQYALDKKLVLNRATVTAGFTPAGGGSNVFIGPITLSLTNTFNISSGDLHLSNSISGSGGLAKAGARTLWLHAPNTYTGPTTINASSGKIALGAQSSLASKVIQVGSGSTLDVTASPAFSLGGGQVLGGAGTVAGGNVVIGPGATLLTGMNDNTVQTLTMSGSLAIQTGGTNRVVVNKTSTLSNNKVSGLASVQIGGTLAVVSIGNPLAAGDVMTLFEAASRTGGGLDSITPATPGPGLAWDTSTLLADGNLRVKVGVDPAHTTITARMTDDQVILSWPAGLGWGLQVQTNAPGTGLGSNWFDVEGSTTNAEMTFPIDPAAGSTFYRLIYR